MRRKIRVGIIGAGNMGSAIMTRIRSKFNVCICEKNVKRRTYLKRKYNIPSVDLDTLVKKSKVIILAIKPQNFKKILNEVRQHITNRHLVISIAAGISIRHIEDRLGEGVRVIRTMPNNPAQIGRGITAIAKGKYASNSDLRIANKIFKCIGKTYTVSEKKIDIVTAVSGSGPAYNYFFKEAFIDAANKAGLSKEEAYLFVDATLAGSSAVIDESGKSHKVLRKEVTSKGGTTEAALSKSNQSKFKQLLLKIIKDAKRRAKELSK